MKIIKWLFETLRRDFVAAGPSVFDLPVKAPVKTGPLPFKLPTLAKFEQMDIRERGQVFVEWLRSRDKSETYFYSDHQNCALAQFGKAISGVDSTGGQSDMRVFTSPYHPIKSRSIPVFYDDGTSPLNFGSRVATFHQAAYKVERVIS